MPFPPEDKSLAGLLNDFAVRLNLIERRINKSPPGTTVATTAPTSIPSRVGEVYIRTDTHKVYVATGTTAVSDWSLLN